MRHPGGGVGYPLDDPADLKVVRRLVHRDPHPARERGVAYDEVILPRNQPVQPVDFRIPPDDIPGKSRVASSYRSHRILLHAPREKVHPLDGVLKRHLCGVEEILDRYRGLRFADHLLPDRHLGELPDQLQDERRQPSLRFKADDRKARDIRPYEETEQVGAVRRGTDLEDPGPLGRLSADLRGDQKRAVGLHDQPHRIVLLDVRGPDPLFRQGYDV
jgi:hypothetical protein